MQLFKADNLRETMLFYKTSMLFLPQNMNMRSQQNCVNQCFT